MAVDSAEKRASCIGIGLPFRISLPVASGVIGVGPRQHLCGMYAGIEAGAVAVPKHYCGIVTIRPAYSGQVSIGPVYDGLTTIVPAYEGMVERDQC